MAPRARPALHATRHFASLGLCGLLLAGGAVGVSAAARPTVRPLYCEWIKRLGLDFLNDTTNIPEAWQRHDGAIHYDRLAAFHAYALTNELRFFRNITSERRALRIRPLHLPGDSSPLGRVYYAETRGNPRFYYRPSDQRRAARPVLLSFEYRCAAPAAVYRRYFLLDVRSTPAPLNAAWEGIPPLDDVERFPDPVPDCPEIQRLGVDYLADEREGVAARDTRSGTYRPDREAAFQVYGLGAEAAGDRHLTRQHSRVQVRLWTPPGSRPATGTLRFENSGRRPRIVYTPDGLSNRDRAVVLTFGYRCGLHTRRRDFLLKTPYTP